MITSLAQLSATTRAAATSFLDASVAALPDADLRPGVREDLEAALLDQLDPASTPDDLAAVIDRLGPVEAEVFGTADAADAPGRDGRAPRGPRGRLWGIPFDLRPPSGDRVRAAWWDPTGDRILVPRVFGLGWTVNVGALAVRLGLIEPDAEDEPFTSTPEEAFKAAALLPLGLAAATVAHYAVRGGSLPERLPTHWDAAGRPDRWSGKASAAATDLAVALASAGVAVAGTRAGRPRPPRAGLLAAASGAATLAACLTVWRSAGDRPRWWAGPATVLAAAGASAATLVGLALAGRDAEQRRDLGGRR